MDLIQQIPIECAFCGESIDILVDCSLSNQEYVEDCQVCCRPLVITVSMDESGDAHVTARNEND